METKPTFMGMIVAKLKGEISTQTLEAYRLAGSTVYTLLDAAEATRLEAKTNGQNAWTTPPAQQAQLLYTWNAFVLQTLGDEFLDADYKHDPMTVGYAPAVTHEQTRLCYMEVEGWLSEARQAESDPGYQVRRALPAGLPAWQEADPCPMAHLYAMVAALRSLKRHAEVAMSVFEDGGTPDDKAKEAGQLRQLMAESVSKSEYVDRLMAGAINAELHEQIEKQAQQAIEGFYKLGQLAAMPTLLAKEGQPKTGATGRRQLPVAKTDNGFDPWCMTDPATVNDLRRDSQAKAAIDNMWRYDPDSRATLRMQQEIEDLLAAGDISIAVKPNGKPYGHYMCTPYAAIYQAHRAVTFAGEKIRKGNQFTYEISAEGVNVGETFRREVMQGQFGPAPEIDYCDPNVKGPHDD